MLGRLLCALALTFLGSFGALATNENVLCLQNQLAAAGYDPGTIDGHVRPGTYDAFDSYADARRLPGSRRLSPGTALSLCRLIGLDDAAMQRFWPVSTGTLRMVFEPGLSPALQTFIEERLPAIHRQTAQQLGITLAGTDTVIVGTSRAALSALLDEHLPEGIVFENADTALDEQCTRRSRLGGFTVGGTAVFCLPAQATLGGSVDPTDLIDLIAHEVVHLVVRQILPAPPGDSSDPERVALTGPLWLHEGHAVVHADGISHHSSPRDLRRSLLRHFAGRSLPDLRQLETRGALARARGDVYRVGAIAVSLLIDAHGEEALGTLYEAMARDVPFDAAFAQSFGYALNTFYDGYAALARSAVDAGPRQPAADPVRCVQAQLNAAGHNAGYADGQIGPRTLAALAALRDVAGLHRAPALTPESAALWCRLIGLDDPAQRDFWPAREQPVALSVAWDVDAATAAHIRDRFPALHRRAAMAFQVPLSTTDRVVIASSGEGLRGLIAGDWPEPIRALIDEGCTGGPAAATVAGLAALCLGPGPAPDLDETLAGMAATLIWHQTTGPEGAGTTTPAWLRAGFVHYVELTAGRQLEPTQMRLGLVADIRRRPRIALDAATGAEARSRGAVAVSLLVAAQGSASVGQLMADLGAGVPFAEAFEDIFGVPPDRFAAHFPGLPTRRIAASFLSPRDLGQPAVRPPVN
ncbi:MAG: hypothetical protein H6898_03335 [Rhodobacter sp.]|nr:hypothetical protein [Paracoccaceae bacterium]MCC0075599.1 hypothetical protein [Rhodobacter sp.]